MIKFFRKIRYRFLIESKFKKYLAYAFGEIVLVVIGILIALSINNWNQVQKKNRLEKNYLIRLISEIKTDTTSFSNSIRSAERYNLVLSNINLILNDNNSSDSLLVRSVYLLYSEGLLFPKYAPSIAIFDDLLATGQLKVIRNDTLRNQIINLYKFYNSNINSANGYIEKKLIFEVRLWYEFDMLKHMDYTQHLFVKKSIIEEANYINQNRDYYIKHSAFNFLIKRILIRINKESNIEAKKVLNNLELELNQLSM